MYRTITLGSCVAVQGIFVKNMQNGKIAVRVGKETFVGKPVAKAMSQTSESLTG